MDLKVFITTGESTYGEELGRRAWITLAEELNQQYVEQFASRVRGLFPGCPPGIEKEVAEHACRKYSGCVGRSAAAKALDEQAVRLAVTAHVRHVETEYDSLLAGGFERQEARNRVAGAINRLLARWELKEK